MVDPTAVVIGARSVVCVAVVKDGSGASGSTTRDSPNLECLCPVRRRAHPVHDWAGDEPFQCPKDRDVL